MTRFCCPPERAEKFFLRITKPTYYETTMSSLDIHLYLQSRDCNVPKIIFSKDGNACVPFGAKEEKHYALLYEFLEGEEVNPEQDAEELLQDLGKRKYVITVMPHDAALLKQ